MEKHKLPELPYAYDALQPHVSSETLKFHHDKHHAGYVKKLNELVEGTKLEDKTLEDMILTQPPGKVFNNAGQVWNHTFYWNCMSPSKDLKPSSELEDKIKQGFGSLSQFKTEFAEVATGQFGSGWAWLVKDNAGQLKAMSTANADSPLQFGFTPLLVCDVWEHAYYIDYRNDRGTYVEKFFEVVNWEFVSQNLQLEGARMSPSEKVRSIR